MKKLAVLFWLLSAPAYAAGECIGLFCPMTPTGDTALDKAIDICNAHSLLVPLPVFDANGKVKYRKRFDDGFENCENVRTKWSNSEAAKAQAERIAKENADKALIQNVK